MTDFDAEITSVDTGHETEPASDAAPAADAGLEKFVSFCIGERLYGIHAPAVSEVSHRLNVTPLPKANANLCGIAPLRGEIVAVVDIRALVEESSPAVQPKTKTLVLRSFGDDDIPIAFEIDKLGEIVSLPVNELHPVPGRNSAYLFGESTAAGQACLIVDHTKLASALA